MASRQLHRVLKDGRARLNDVVGVGDGYAASTRRRLLRHWALVLPLVVVFVAVAIGGYSLGASQRSDADRARQAGTIAGEVRGRAVGTIEGYPSAFRSARRHAYHVAYREAYRSAYRSAFERADLTAPRRVEVSGP